MLDQMEQDNDFFAGLIGKEGALIKGNQTEEIVTGKRGISIIACLQI